MQDLFVLAELLYEFFDALFVEKLFYLGRVGTLIRKRDFQTGLRNASSRNRVARRSNLNSVVM